MSIITWTEQMSIGLKTFDDEHKKLVGLLVTLSDAMRAGKGKDALGAILDELVQYTVTHFAHEERLMLLHAYHGLAEHKAQHDALTQSVLNYQQRLAAGKVMAIELFGFLTDWLKKHIQTEDKKYAPFLAAKGIS